jgi:hypothetical protein
MVDETTPSDLGARVNLDSGQRAVELREHPRQQKEATAMQFVAQPVEQDGVKSGITEENLDRTLSGRIPPKDRIDLFPNSPEHIPIDYRTRVEDSAFWFGKALLRIP